MAEMASIRVDPGSLILPSDESLYVVSKRGTAVLRSTGLLQLHQRLHSYLEQGCSEQDLVAAAGEISAGAVRAYLKAMVQSGAVYVEKNGATNGHGASRNNPVIGIAAHQPDLPVRSFVADGMQVLISLDGTIPESSGSWDICILFAQPDAIWNHLLRSNAPNRYLASCAYYIFEDGPEQTAKLENKDLRRRAVYANWLLQNTLSLPRSSRYINVYRLETRTGSMARLLCFDYRRPFDFLTLPEKFGMVESTEAEQSPLASAKVGHRIAPASAIGFGIRHDHSLHESLIGKLLAQSILHFHDKTGFRMLPDNFKKNIGKTRIQAASTEFDSIDNTMPSHCMSTSLLGLRAMLIEDLAAQTSFDAVSSGELDLLGEASDHWQIKYLADVLRTRRSSLRARFISTDQGLYGYEIEGIRRFSIIRNKALRDTLLDLVATTFYQDAANVIGSSALLSEFSPFIGRADLRKLVRKHEARVASENQNIFVLLQRLYCWGRYIWIGRIESSPGA